jgi:hypothetical protein
MLLLLLPLSGTLLSQVDAGENKSFATYGNMTDNHHNGTIRSQTVFFYVPDQHTGDLYLRVFDPDCGGSFDRPDGLWETNTLFEVYGGDGCISGTDARNTVPLGSYKSGTLLHSALFAKESGVDGKWVSFGPFSSGMGEALADFPGYRFFKLIVEGRTGDDGNVYALAISSTSTSNAAIDAAGVFEYRRTYLQGDSLVVDIPDLIHEGDPAIQLPVKLKPLSRRQELNIIAEPIEE